MSACEGHYTSMSSVWPDMRGYCRKESSGKQDIQNMLKRKADGMSNRKKMIA